MAGVLVFVKQHHPVAGPQLLADLWMCRGEPGGRRHLRTEVHHLLCAHPGAEGVDERHQHAAPGLGVEHVEQRAIRAAAALTRPGGQGVHQPFEFDMGVTQLAGIDQVLGEFIGQRTHHRGDRGRTLVDGQRVRITADDVEGQLPHLGFAEQPGVGFHRQQQPELAQQRPGESVVGTDHRGTGSAGRLGAEVAGQPGQSGAHPAQQLPGRLTGEGQAEYLSRIGVAVGHQPHHPGGHGLGLARAGTGDDHQRAGLRGDHRDLLVGGLRKPQRGSEFDRAECHDGSAVLVGIAWAGHDGRIGQCEQPSLTRAAKCGPAVAAAAARTFCNHCAVSSGPTGLCSRSVALPDAAALPT